MSKTVIQKRKDIIMEFVNGISRTEVLKDTYDQAKFFQCVLKEGTVWEPELYSREDICQIFLFTKGSGYIAMKKNAFNIKEVSAFVPDFDKESFTIHAGSDLEFLQILCTMGEYDKLAFEISALSLPRFRGLSECWTYEENFKGPGLKSLMVLEHRNLGRFSMGAVLGKGPNVSGDHVHPDLEQWYIVLPGSKFIYTSDNEDFEMTEGDISFTGHGAHHSSRADEGQQLDYVWFELCEDGYIGELPEDVWPVK